MKKFLGVLLIVVSAILLATSLFFAIGFSLGTGDLISPASTVMPIILTVVTGMGSILLLIASLKWKRKEPAKKHFILAVSLYALAVILIPITKAINQQMIVNMFF